MWALSLKRIGDKKGISNETQTHRPHCIYINPALHSVVGVVSALFRRTFPFYGGATEVVISAPIRDLVVLPCVKGSGIAGFSAVGVWISHLGNLDGAL